MGRDRLLLLEHFRRLYATQALCQPFTLDPAAEALWLAYGFPGNVRELRNIVIRLTARHPGQRVTGEQLLAEFDTTDAADLAAQQLPAASSSQDSAAGNDGEQRLQAALKHLQTSPGIDLDATLAAWERSYIEAALELCSGNVSRAARRLGINRSTLYNRMESWHRS
jgi:two-component system nitrogen regulation response regulator GlnG